MSDVPSSVPGRGDVRVSGQNMYRIPLILGLLQVTNLSLPISSPFENAFVRYSVEGQLVSLEEIHLSNKTMDMEGHGHIDFGSKQVEMSFATQHPDWLSFPILGGFWNTAQSELLRIHVTGSLESPKVSASSLDTVTTTVDHVFHGEQGN
jgi:AsmA-like C-terminal region